MNLSLTPLNYFFFYSKKGVINAGEICADDFTWKMGESQQALQHVINTDTLAEAITMLACFF